MERLCDAIGRPELGSDPRYATHIKRVENYEEINDIVAAWIRTHPVSEALAVFEANGVPHSMIYSPADILADPHYAARGSIATIEHPTVGTIKVPATVPHFSAVPSPEIRPAPDLGHDTQSVLQDILGMSEAEISALRASGVA